MVNGMAPHASLLAWRNHKDRGALRGAAVHGDTQNRHERSGVLAAETPGDLDTAAD